VDRGIQLGGGDVVDAVLAFANDAGDFVEAGIAGVVYFEGAAGAKAELANGKDDGIEDGFLRRIERAVDEYVFASDVGLRHELSA